MGRKFRIVDSHCRFMLAISHINCQLFGMARIQRMYEGMAAKSGLDCERLFTSC